MQKINLLDSKQFYIEETSRSVGIFCKKTPQYIGHGHINALKKEAERFPDKNIRLCLHSSPDSNFHDMIILEKYGKYYPPHKHMDKGETWHILEGSLATFIFSESGEIVESGVLDPKENIILRVDLGIYHSIMPLSEIVIYHESKPGPFLGKNDSIYPKWAPDRSKDSEIREYYDRIKRVLP